MNIKIYLSMLFFGGMSIQCASEAYINGTSSPITLRKISDLQPTDIWHPIHDTEQTLTLQPGETGFVNTWALDWARVEQVTSEKEGWLNLGGPDSYTSSPGFQICFLDGKKHVDQAWGSKCGDYYPKPYSDSSPHVDVP